MKKTKVTSSHLKTIEYDKDAKELTIGFKDGSEYEFLDVTKTEVRNLMSAKSKGKNFWKNIREEKITIQTTKGKRK